MPRAWIARAAVLAVAAAGGLVLLDYLAPLQWPTVLVYGGIGLALVGLAGLAIPCRWSGLPRRIAGLAVSVGGLALVWLGLVWPAAAHTTQAPATRLDAFMPVYHFVERHEERIHAEPARVEAALRQMTFADIPVFRTLGRIRAAAMGARLPQGPDPMASLKVIETMSGNRTGFFPLDMSGRELVFGMAGQPWNNAARPTRLTSETFRAWAAPNSVKIASNFVIEDAGGGCTRVVTETRVQATDDVARRTMAKYWRFIYPGSGMIRRGMLASMREKAESTH